MKKTIPFRSRLFYFSFFGLVSFSILLFSNCLFHHLLIGKLILLLSRFNMLSFFYIYFLFPFDDKLYVGFLIHSESVKLGFRRRLAELCHF